MADPANGRDPASLRILVTNDDGIHAPGLKVLERIARALSKDVWVAAPEFEQSGASHSLTLTMPLRVRRIARRRFAIRGTPTDCVMLAVCKLIGGRRPDLVLSGVNRGGNLAEDVTYSGTIAAAMEGTILNIPSVALSQCYGDGARVPWDTAQRHGAEVVRQLVEAGWPAHVLMNVNFPDCPPEQVQGTEICRQGKRDASELFIDERVDARAQTYYWLGFRRQESQPEDGTDLAAVANDRIAVTPLHLDLTERQLLGKLRAAVT